MILVTGATGNAGSQVVRALLEQRRARCARSCATPRRPAASSATRPSSRSATSPTPQSVRAALDGVRAARPLGRRRSAPRGVGDGRDRRGGRGGRPPDRQALVDRGGAGAPVAFWDWHGQIEQHLRRSAVPAVVLRSSFFMSNVLAAAEQVAREGRLYAPAGEARDRDDRPARRRRGRGGGPDDGGPRRPHVRPHRPRRRSPTPRSPRELSRGDRPRRRVRRRPRRGRAGTQLVAGGPARRSSPSRSSSIFAMLRAGRRGAGHGDGRVADRRRAARLRRVRTRPRRPVRAGRVGAAR